jgi:hypothetical protein
MVYLDKYCRQAKPKPIFSGRQRDGLISRIMDALDDWRFSPFENEGESRHLLRTVLCLDGYSWPIADTEATELVTAGLKRNGAVRPNWSEGQRRYCELRDTCLRCSGALTEGRLFCSTLCAKEHFESKRALGLVNDHEYKRKAYAAMIREGYRQKCISKTAPRECLQCGSEFRVISNSLASKYCSKSCQHESLRRKIERGCEHCGTMFLPKLKTTKFCSLICAGAVISQRQFVGTCQHCECSFIANKAHSKFCGASCRSKAFALRRRAAVIIQFPTIDPAVFDREFQRAA